MPYSGEDQKWIRSQVNTELIGREIITHDSVESTNDLAKSLVTDWNREGTVILADSPFVQFRPVKWTVQNNCSQVIGEAAPFLNASIASLNFFSLWYSFPALK